MSSAGRVAAALALLFGCGGDDAPAHPDASVPDQPEPDAEPPADVCNPVDGAGVFFDLDAEPCNDLSSYRFFTDAAAQVPNDRVVPYDVNSPLFSDYANKHRFVWLPPGESMTYAETGAFAMPVGTVLIKTFGYLADLRDPASPERLVETRLLVHRDSGWEGVVYLWDEDQGEAHLSQTGAIVPVQWIHTDGAERELDYLVPNTNQCENCHSSADVTEPIGLQARHLNRDFDYPDGPENQLTALTTVGYLTGAPADPADAPRAAVFDDPDSGTVEERARAWLDINCAHCHDPDGPARTSGLDLRGEQEDPTAYGVCKAPIAAGAGSGGRQYGIVPGAPDESILVFRLESVEPEIRMPELLRQTVQEESVTLVREWITAMTGECAPPE